MYYGEFHMYYTYNAGATYASIKAGGVNTIAKKCHYKNLRCKFGVLLWAWAFPSFQARVPWEVLTA